MNIKQIVVSIAFCGFSAGIGNLPVPVPHIVVHEAPKPRLTGLLAIFQGASKKSGLPPRLIAAVVHVESRGKIKAVSSAGAIGPMQLMPTTANMLGVNPYNIEQNIIGGSEYLAKLIRQFGNIKKALIAYNEGPTALMQGKVYTQSVTYAKNVIRYESMEKSTGS